MFRLLKFLFTGSWHECTFVQVDHHKTNTFHRNGDRLPHTITHTYVSRCSHCGKIQSRTISI